MGKQQSMLPRRCSGCIRRCNFVIIFTTRFSGRGSSRPPVVLHQSMKRVFGISRMQRASVCPPFIAFLDISATSLSFNIALEHARLTVYVFLQCLFLDPSTSVQ